MITITDTYNQGNLVVHKKRVTIKDVAKKAGVSTQTVSRVMNDFPYVADNTRQRVEAVVEELGYQPSTLARSLSQQRSYTLGIVIFGLDYIGPAKTLNGISSMADKLNYMLVMRELADFDTASIDFAIDSLLARQVDGIIWAVPEMDESHKQLNDRIKRITVPIMFIAIQPREGISSVATDNYLGGKMATRHLLETGCKHIAHISGPMGWWEAEERMRGWKDALLDQGIQPKDSHCVEGNWSSASGEQAFIELIESYPEMDGIFVGNDQMALSVLQQAHIRGISIPEELSVIGFDDIDEAQYFYPSLSTIAQDLQLVGGLAVKSVVKMIEAQRKNQAAHSHFEFIEPTLLRRNSSK